MNTKLVFLLAFLGIASVAACSDHEDVLNIILDSQNPDGYWPYSNYNLSVAVDRVNGFNNMFGGDIPGDLTMTIYVLAYLNTNYTAEVLEWNQAYTAGMVDIALQSAFPIHYGNNIH
jgi:hypothetical protein